jgi:hypothetical protein
VEVEECKLFYHILILEHLVCRSVAESSIAMKRVLTVFCNDKNQAAILKNIAFEFCGFAHSESYFYQNKNIIIVEFETSENAKKFLEILTTFKKVT